MGLGLTVEVLDGTVIGFGLASAGEDDLEALTSRMEMYAARCAWIREKADWMKKVLREALVKGEGKA